jgi:hypothetical protein
MSSNRVETLYFTIILLSVPVAGKDSARPERCQSEARSKKQESVGRLLDDRGHSVLSQQKGFTAEDAAGSQRARRYFIESQYFLCDPAASSAVIIINLFRDLSGQHLNSVFCLFLDSQTRLG